MHSIIPLFPGLPGGPELLIVLFVLVLLFGANKIPKLARSTGQAMGEFKRGREEIEKELEDMTDEEIEQLSDEELAAAKESSDSSSTTAVADEDEETETTN